MSFTSNTYTVTISYSPFYINQVPEMLTFITKYTEVLFDSCISTQNHTSAGQILYSKELTEKKVNISIF
jgi:hypothetical protein